MKNLFLFGVNWKSENGFSWNYQGLHTLWKSVGALRGLPQFEDAAIAKTAASCGWQGSPTLWTLYQEGQHGSRPSRLHQKSCHSFCAQDLSQIQSAILWGLGMNWAWGHIPPIEVLYPPHHRPCQRLSTRMKWKSRYSFLFFLQDDCHSSLPHGLPGASTVILPCQLLI